MVLVRCAMLVAAFALSGCSILTPHLEPVEREPEIAVKPEVSVKVPEPPRLPSVAIVLTSSRPAYADVARELTLQFDNFEVFDLSDDSRPPVTILRLINDSDSGAVVAIGLRAAQSSVAMSKKPVIFSQVFNYQDHDLVTENSRGVAAITPLAAQISAWKKVDPEISRIGAIIGKGHEDLIAEAELAAQRHGLELQMKVTSSDQETLYVFKRMIRDIDGFWLFPDNRIFSRRALQQIIDEAQRRHVPILVPNESMLQMGASISVSSVASDIAQTITDIIRQIQAGKLAEVPPISPLSEILVRTNDSVQVAER
jgi:ABC-type uncharacterized transport system substrate-binding protein